MPFDDPYFDRRDGRNREELWSAASPRGVVACAHYRAADVGARVLREGGNAIDAAIATSLALAVCEPAASGLGGMALLMVHLADQERTFCIESPCRAPANVRPEDLQGLSRKQGPGAIAVPGYLRAIEHARSSYGTWPLDRLLPGAIELAEEGYAITDLQHGLLDTYHASLAAHSGGAIFLDADGAPRRPGQWFRQPALAATLKRLARHGERDFYEGDLAHRVASDLERRGSWVSLADLRTFPEPEESDPLIGAFGRFAVHTPRPPAGGATLLQMLSMKDALEPSRVPPRSGEEIAWIARIIQHARRDRRRYARRSPERLVERLTNGARSRRLVRELESRGGETTHLCVVDAWGNTVSMTQSIERCFGSKEAAVDLGFLYNGYLKAFKLEASRHPHFLRPGAAARSNATPTIGFGPGGELFAVGCTGSERMASAIFTTLVELERGDPFQAVAAPRWHVTPEGICLLEQERFAEEHRRALVDAGFQLQALDPHAFQMGGLQLARRRDGVALGVADPRRDGAARIP